MNAPVRVSDEVVRSGGVQQLRLVGILAMVIAAGLFVVVLFPNDLRSKMIIGLVAGAVFVVGWMMWFFPKKG
jgi:ABC-type Fe3+-siderophore transport system permease subunit